MISTVVICATVLTGAAIGAYYGIEKAKIEKAKVIEHDQERPRKIWERERTKGGQR